MVKLPSTARLRFAPSPTGNLHIGGLRTALYNHLLARQSGGKWILRIEDTDQARKVEGSVDALRRSLEWAGLDYDEGPGTNNAHSSSYIQSERLDLYRQQVNKLIDTGKAYRCFATPDELAQLRADTASNSGSAGGYDRRGLRLTEEDVARRLKSGEKYVVRFKSSPDPIPFVDLVYSGTYAHPTAAQDDTILLKSDGFPTYHLASVVDDHFMGITHVLRGEEWFPSVNKHLQLYRAFGWKIPEFAHLPLLINPDGSKLSKRHGAVSVGEYEREGYEPSAINNFVALMGWGGGQRILDPAREPEHPGHTENPHESDFLTMAEMIERFDIDKISKSPSQVDKSRLDHLQKLHVDWRWSVGGPTRQAFVKQVQDMFEARYPGNEYVRDTTNVSRFVEFDHLRVQFVHELGENNDWLFVDPDLTSAGARQMKKGTSDSNYEIVLNQAIQLLSPLSEEEFLKPDLLLSTMNSANKKAAMPRERGQAPVARINLWVPMRHALTGQKIGPSVAQAITVLGKERTLRRLKRALDISQDMCGILGLLLHDLEAAYTTQAAVEIVEGLSLLQHRGQDACGVVTCGAPRGRFYQVKANGMVQDVFDNRAVSGLRGLMGIGHVRYPTAGSSAHAEAQPFYVNSPYGLVMAHNGNLTNTQELRGFLDEVAHRHINTDSDSELLLNILANNLQKTGKKRINEEDILTAIKDLMAQCSGAYACTVMIAGFGLVGFRDPNGIRPLGLASRQSAANPEGKDWLLASESVVSDACSFSNWEDVGPGEAVIITRNAITRRQCAPSKPFAPDIFEYVYFARPDSTIDGISVYRARMAMGDLLAEQVRKELARHGETVDVVIPIPDTSRVAATQVAKGLGLPYREGFIKNRYVGRTFIMPGQEMRKKNVRRKLNAMPLEFAGKNVLLVDDSIVRGTTSKEIIQMAKDVGAKKVMIASCAPPIRHSNVYGIDMPSPHELVAHDRTESEIATEIGADLVIFQTIEDLIKSCQQFNPSIEQFECSVFTGEYVTGDVDQAYLQSLVTLRNDNAKLKLGTQVGEGVHEVKEAPIGCSGPLNGAEGAIGLANGMSGVFTSSGHQNPNDTVGLHNSWHSAHNEQQ
ncbi:amidophosphoribosyltransferase [Phaffia rhodozyma]|uniref:Glutamate--tRNA ligase, mitochondrial n=1 Tax=Phaffia rhodozyma TaxID=264483 RepID=A0A0F7SPN7_PHARH|nr:amidophosphoribosyltransferase [Phaffia rhodozyma]